MKTFRILGLVRFAGPSRFHDSVGSGAVIAYNIAAGMNGNQAWGGVLGMDFDVEHAINVTALGAFDSGSNGILGTTITTELWSRNRGFAAGHLAGRLQRRRRHRDPGLRPRSPAPRGRSSAAAGSRTSPADLSWSRARYTIVAYGYSGSEPNGNLGVAGAFHRQHRQ